MARATVEEQRAAILGNIADGDVWTEHNTVVEALEASGQGRAILLVKGLLDEKVIRRSVGRNAEGKVVLAYQKVGA